MAEPAALHGKRVLVTGGSLGIGLAAAEHCARAGADVILASRTEEDLKRAAENIRQTAGRRASYRVLDVGDADQVRTAAEWVRKEYGALDGLVNCAAIFGPIGPLHTVDLKRFEDAVRVNFLGTVYACHFFAPLMQGRGARIVNFSGGGGTTPFPNYSAYAAGKAAVVRLTENLAEEFRPLGIAVNAVAPGFVLTRLHQETLEAGEAKAGRQFEATKREMARGGVPADKGAELTVFLLSDSSEGINGKLVSAPWDEWKNAEYLEKLRTQKDFATLRRVDGLNVFSK